MVATWLSWKSATSFALTRSLRRLKFTGQAISVTLASSISKAQDRFMLLEKYGSLNALWLLHSPRMTGHQRKRELIFLKRDGNALWGFRPAIPFIAHMNTSPKR